MGSPGNGGRCENLILRHSKPSGKVLMSIHSKRLQGLRTQPLSSSSNASPVVTYIRALVVQQRERRVRDQRPHSLLHQHTRCLPAIALHWKNTNQRSTLRAPRYPSQSPYVSCRIPPTTMDHLLASSGGLRHWHLVLGYTAAYPCRGSDFDFSNGFGGSPDPWSDLPSMQVLTSCSG